MVYKFYFIDTDIKRALDRTLAVHLVIQTSLFGEAFENSVILDSKRLLSMLALIGSFVLTTKDGVRIELIFERLGQFLHLI